MRIVANGLMLLSALILAWIIWLDFQLRHHACNYSEKHFHGPKCDLGHIDQTTLFLIGIPIVGFVSIALLGCFYNFDRDKKRYFWLAVAAFILFGAASALSAFVLWMAAAAAVWAVG